MQVHDLEIKICNWLKESGSVVVALSGGTDSSVVATYARKVLGDRMLAVTGVSPSLSPQELNEIGTLCRLQSIPHERVTTHELTQQDYIANTPDRCFHCKHELFSKLEEVRTRLGFSIVVDGTHAGDLQGHRPGKRAGDALGVRSPLAELGLNKSDIRRLATHLGLVNAQRPSQPCLSSRIAYGVAVTPERLEKVDRAEAFLKELGFDKVRVRLHNEIARVEVPPSRFAELISHAPKIHAELKAIGFVWVSLDLGGLRSGSLLEILPDIPT